MDKAPFGPTGLTSYQKATFLGTMKKNLSTIE